MTVLAFMSESPWLSFFLAWLFLAFAFKCWNRFWRHWNIRKHGYPPIHCDADGDFREEPRT